MSFSANKFCMALSFLLAALPACNPDPPKVGNLMGEYRIISGERNGTPIDQKELNGSVIRFGDKTITTFDNERKETFGVTYTLDTKQVPWQITMISTKAPEVGAIAKGLVEVDQNNVKLIYALPNGQPPKEFKSGERQQMFVLTKTSAASPEKATTPAGT